MVIDPLGWHLTSGKRLTEPHLPPNPAHWLVIAAASIKGKSHGALTSDRNHGQHTFLLACFCHLRKPTLLTVPIAWLGKGLADRSITQTCIFPFLWDLLVC